MASSYAKLANLPDEDEEEAKPRSSYARLAALSDEDDSADVPATAIAVQTSDELPADFPRHEDGESTGDWWKAELSALMRPETWKRQAKLAGRAVTEGLTAIPVMAADAGIGARNLVTGSNYKLASEMNREGLDQFFPRPQTWQEKLSGFAESVLAGARTPAPQAAKQAPAGFVKPSDSPVAPLVQEARDAGYVLPPATAQPGSTMARLAEGAAGKASTAQAASVKNQQTTNKLVRQALGLADDEAITPAKLATIRESAGKVYEKIGNAGQIAADEQFVDDLAQLGRGADEIAQSFPGANVGATKQIEELVDSLLQNKFDSKAALQYLRELRKQASGNLSGMNAADPAKQALGMAQREAAATLEDLIGRHLRRNGMAQLADSFADARKTIAITHTVENALNETTGNVIAPKLGQQLAKGKPLSGELETVARFARAFPKAAKEVTESMPGASPLDWATSGIISGVTGHPFPMLLAGVRPSVRKFLMSDPGQKMFAEGAAKPYAGASGVLGLAPSAAIQGARETNE